MEGCIRGQWDERRGGARAGTGRSRAGVRRGNLATIFLRDKREENVERWVGSETNLGDGGLDVASVGGGHGLADDGMLGAELDIADGDGPADRGRAEGRVGSDGHSFNNFAFVDAGEGKKMG